jgi:hypothetical protein
MEPADADVYFGKVLRGTAKGTPLPLAQALKTSFLSLRARVPRPRAADRGRPRFTP